MSQGILIHDDKASIDDDVSLTPLSINPPVRDDKRKSAVQRRREARRKKIETKQKLEKREAIRETEIFRQV